MKRHAAEVTQETTQAEVPSQSGPEDDPRYQAMLAFIKWIYDWSRVNDHNVRERTIKVLKEIGELE